MKLHILGSSSSGNCYLLENGKECLIIEAGINFPKIQKALDYNLDMICGCLISHEHGDHAKYAEDYLKCAVDIYASKGTLDELRISSHRTHEIAPLKQFKIGGYKIIPFDIKHDSVEPLGFLIQHKDMGVLLFATDTYYLPDKYAGLNHIMIECNYVEDILEENVRSGAVNPVVRSRVIASHMELDTCKEFLRANDLSGVTNIVLLHASGINGNKRQFRKEITGLTGKQVFVAEKGLVVDVGNDF